MLVDPAIASSVATEVECHGARVAYLEGLGVRRQLGGGVRREVRPEEEAAPEGVAADHDGGGVGGALLEHPGRECLQPRDAPALEGLRGVVLRHVAPGVHRRDVLREARVQPRGQRLRAGRGDGEGVGVAADLLQRGQHRDAAGPERLQRGGEAQRGGAEAAAQGRGDHDAVGRQAEQRLHVAVGAVGML